ncbi:MAG: site-specific DNA-methyltransferase [bacterium]
MRDLNKRDIEFLIDCLKNGKEIPEVYKYAIFPTKQKEYELVYAGKMRKEDVLADTEEAKPVPLQIEKIFNGKKYPLYSKDWQNLLVFGDNLQILKTFNENKDPLIKDKIKGKVKLIYIDPPFATEDDFQSGQGQKAYADKKKGAEFVEFLRRRLIVAREIMADGGVIFVHLDQKMTHYIKIVLDEVFGKNSFENEIAYRTDVSRGRKQESKWFGNNLNTIYIFSKNKELSKNNYNIVSSLVEVNNPDDEYKKDRYGYYSDSDSGSYSNYSLYKFWEENRLLVNSNTKIKIDHKNKQIITEKGKVRIKYYLEKIDNKYFKRIIPDNIWTDILGLANQKGENLNYPTQKIEFLLKRIIECSTEKGDLVMDFFCGSGTTLAVAEKLNRRWVGCDIGKLAIYTTQKRLLEIDESKDLEKPKKKYGKPAKSFAIVTSGLYDLGKIFALKKDEYIRFVKDLFEIEETKITKIGGVDIDGKKREFYAKIFPYWELKNASVDEKYLQELHKNIGKKIDGRFYIIAPANNVNFISDYHQIGNVRYYFLKVPYQIIKELHKVQFKKLRQPQSKSQINDLDEAIGFHFIRQPEVKSEIKTLKDKVVLKIKKFESAYSQDEIGEKMKNFESLAMLLVDLNYDGEKFMMTNYFFAQDLLNHKKSEEKESEEEIKKKLIKQKKITKEFPKKDCGKQIMAIYVDIYGNEFREVFKVK